MTTERSCELLERQNPGTHGQTYPIVQEPSSPRGCLIVPAADVVENLGF